MERIENLLKQMTLEEKVMQLASFFPNANKRLKIPYMRQCECLHGVMTPKATCFPQAIGLGATWSPELLEEIGALCAKEARTLGMHHAYTPMLAVLRDPRWGRCEEGFGEDAHLVSELGVGIINGLQGKGSEFLDENHIIATAKHFVGDGEPIAGINGTALEISERMLHEVHLRPFKAAVRRANVASIMPGHHSINGVACHAHKHLIQNVLRKEYGFDGIVVSDNGDIRQMWQRLKITDNIVDCAKLALEAGVDTELALMVPFSENRAYGTKLVEAVLSGEISEELINTSVLRVLKFKEKLGLLDEAVDLEDDTKLVMMYNQVTGMNHISYASHKDSLGMGKSENIDKLFLESSNELAKKAALKAITLLKNEDNILPLKLEGIKNIAVLGPNSNSILLGGYATPETRYYVSVLDGIKNYVGENAEITHVNGCDPDDYSATDIDKAVEAAALADIVILACGGNGWTCKENEDIDNLSLHGDQQELIKRVHETKTPTVLVLQHGRPMSIVWEQENIPAILDCWYLGQETGNAIADALFGDYCPGGKLPMTVPRNVGQIPCYYNKLPSGRTPQYYKATTAPLYPFGFGLSYTTFEMTSPNLDKAKINKKETVSVSVDITNTGSFTGDEVVQMYIQDEYSSLVRPIKELKGFKRVTLSPNQTKRIEFNIGFEELCFYKDGEWVLEEGDFTVGIGNSSEEMKCITLTVF